MHPKIRESCCNDTFVVPSSLENASWTLVAVFYPPSTERKARVRAWGANEQSPSGKLPSRSYDPTDTRTDTRDHFFSSLLSLSAFFQHSQRNSFAALGRHDWSTTRLRADDATRRGAVRCGAACRRYSLRHTLYASIIHVVTWWGNLTVQLAYIEMWSNVNIVSLTRLFFCL